MSTLSSSPKLYLILALGLTFLASSHTLFGAARVACEPKEFQSATDAPTYGSLAADFNLMTTEGALHLQAQWTSCELFVVFKTFTVPETSPLSGLSKLTNTLWQSKLDYLLQYSPRNAHYIFVSQNSDPAQRLIDQSIILKNRDDALALLPPAEQVYWKARIHISTDDISTPGNSAAWLANIGVESFVIDRFQHVKPIGVGAYSPLLTEGDLLKLAMEAQFYNFQWQREQDLKAKSSDRIIPAFKGDVVQAGWQAFGGKINEVEFPAAEVMAQYDQMFLDLELSCDKSSCVYPEGNYYYDRIVELYLCEDETDVHCEKELGRWITPFGLGGRWVHDVSPLLALIRKGGKQRLRFHTVDKYSVTLNFRLGSRSRAALKPFAYQEVFKGGVFDLSYNQRDAINFTVPAGTKRVELVSTTTGHGWGRDTENCAEFCVTDHEWTVNSQNAFVNSLSAAGDSFACFLATDQGVIPNQPGTWFYGRSGWCPGLEVKPKVWDITTTVDLAGSNTIRYRGLFKGADYSPLPNPEGVEQGYAPEINLRSYLVFSK